MKLGMFAVTFHKSDNNNLDVSGTSQTEKVDFGVMYGLLKYEYGCSGHPVPGARQHGALSEQKTSGCPALRWRVNKSGRALPYTITKKTKTIQAESYPS